MSSERRLRFRIRRADGSEIEIEGSFDYVKERFEQHIKELPPPQPNRWGQPRTELEDIVERTPEGRLYLSIPVDCITAKEAVAVVLSARYPTPLSYDEISSLLRSGWKTTKLRVVRARASELKDEGRLIQGRSGRYELSDTGVQWVRSQILPKIRSRAAARRVPHFVQSVNKMFRWKPAA